MNNINMYLTGRLIVVGLLLLLPFVACAQSEQAFANIVQARNNTDDKVENSVFTNAVTITYANGSATVSTLPAGVTADVSKADVTIKSALKEVEYILKGSTTDGSFKIYSDNKFKITLDGVNITNRKGPAVNIQSGKRCFVVLRSESRLTDSNQYAASGSEDMKACFFSEGQLIFSGQGLLVVQGNKQHAICSDDYIRIRDGVSITVTGAEKDGFHANEYLIVDGGTIDIKTKGDGIDVEKGDIAIDGGTLKIAITGDSSKGIKAKGNMEIKGGTIDVSTTGDAVYENNDISSPSCIKIDGELHITGADTKIVLNSTGSGGKGISNDKDLVINNGDIKVTTTGQQMIVSRNMTSSAKGIKSEGNLTINGGNLVIRATGGTESEGLESKKTLTINGGKVDVRAYDDAVNASNAVVFNGGVTLLYSMFTDGVDSNGTITITGGVVISSGGNSPEGAFDCDRNTFSITGGTVIGVGGSASMPTESATKQSVLVFGTEIGEELINIQTKDGKSLLTYRMPRERSRTALLFSSPDLKQNTEYVIRKGGSVQGATEVITGYYTGGRYTGGTIDNTYTQTALITTVGELPRFGRGGGGFGRGFQR